MSSKTGDAHVREGAAHARGEWLLWQPLFPFRAGQARVPRMCPAFCYDSSPADKLGSSRASSRLASS